MEVDPRHIDIITPNLKRRYSGVTSTVIRLVPLQAKQIAIASTGPILPDNIPQFPLLKLLTLSRSGPSGARIWHSRRNIEMLVGLVLKWVFRKRFKFVFTSAAQRRRGRYSRWLIRKMDRVIAASDNAASYLEVPATTILHGIDAQVFAPLPDRAAVRAQLGLDENAVLVGCFGRLRHQKGTDLFVDALVTLLPRHPDVQGIIMGGVTQEHQAFVDDLKGKIANAGLSDRLRILPEDQGFTIAPWFGALDVFVAPQRWEGFGLTPLEAMACGVPVVATRVGAFETLVAHGETGILIPPKDAQALNSALEPLLMESELRRKMSIAARQKVLAQHQIQTEATAINAVYRQLLAQE